MLLLFLVFATNLTVPLIAARFFTGAAERIGVVLGLPP
jgi:hypothetical protein